MNAFQMMFCTDKVFRGFAMAELEATIKKDFMVKRSLMKGRIKTESYKGRWFVLSMNFLRYCDGTIEVGPTVSCSCRTEQ